MSPNVPIGRHVAIYGPSGAGKSTLARALGSRLGLPVLELDDVFHPGPSWQEVGVEEARAGVLRFLAEHADGWVIDGNYAAVRDLVQPLADTAIWLDLPFHTVYPRLMRRTIRRSFSHNRQQERGRDSVRLTFFSRRSLLLWGVVGWRRTRSALAASLVENRPRARVYRLRSSGHVRYLLERAQAADVTAALR